MNARCSPDRILAHHAKNQLSNLIWGRPSSDWPSHLRNQLPIQPKTCSMPADYRIGRDHDERLFPLGQNRRTATQKALSRSLKCGRGWRRFRTTSCWRRTRFSKSRARRVRKRRTSAPNQSKNRLNMAGSYNKLPRGSVSYVAGYSYCKDFGEAQGWLLAKKIQTTDVASDHIVGQTKDQQRRPNLQSAISTVYERSRQ